MTANRRRHCFRNKKPVLSLSAVTDEEDHPLDNEDDSGRRLCEGILRFVQHAPDDIRWTIDKTEF